MMCTCVWEAQASPTRYMCKGVGGGSKAQEHLRLENCSCPDRRRKPCDEVEVFAVEAAAVPTHAETILGGHRLSQLLAIRIESHTDATEAQARNTKILCARIGRLVRRQRDGENKRWITPSSLLPPTPQHWHQSSLLCVPPLVGRRDQALATPHRELCQ